MWISNWAFEIDTKNLGPHRLSGGGFGNDRPISSRECVNVVVSVNVIVLGAIPVARNSLVLAAILFYFEKPMRSLRNNSCFWKKTVLIKLLKKFLKRCRRWIISFDASIRWLFWRRINASIRWLLLRINASIRWILWPSINPRPDRGVDAPPHSLRFFADSEKTAALNGGAYRRRVLGYLTGQTLRNFW